MKKFGLLLLLVSLMLGISYLPASHAWSSITVNRSPQALLAADSAGGLELSGFQNNAYTISDTYVTTGTIIPRSSGSSSINTTFAPAISQACQRVAGNGTCTAGDWTLDFCLATDTTSAGTTTCQTGTGGQNSAVSFSGTGASTPGPAGLSAIVATSNQTLYLLVKGNIGTHKSRILCGNWSMAISASTSAGVASALSHSITTPRSGIFRLGSGCP